MKAITCKKKQQLHFVVVGCRCCICLVMLHILRMFGHSYKKSIAQYCSKYCYSDEFLC